MPREIDPPYLRIVAEIRRRIADGRLAPGDRVPSTRQIAGEWGVALATATKALTTLRQEGLVHARPRVGTVVASPEPQPDPGAGSGAGFQGGAGSQGGGGAKPGVGRERRRGVGGADQELTRERIVRVAIEIADAEGLAALSMRGVAVRLGVATMSTYRHVNSKDDLVLLMADAAAGEAAYPVDVPPGWRARLELGARTLWALYRRHPWMVQISSLSRPLPLPKLLVHAEWALSALDGYGLAPATMLNLHVLLYGYVQGIAINLERETHAEAVTGLSEEEWMDSQAPALSAIAASGDYPAFARISEELRSGYDLDLDEVFESGLQFMLDGFSLLIDG